MKSQYPLTRLFKRKIMSNTKREENTDKLKCDDRKQVNENAELKMSLVNRTFYGKCLNGLQHGMVQHKKN